MSMLRTVERGAIGLLAAYILYTQALGTALISIGLAIIIFAFTKNETFLLCVLAVTLLIKPLNNVINSKPEPMGVEGFQARDPVSVQTRLESVKTTAPLAPKVQHITGILESANILDNTPLQGMDELSNEGVPGASIPASAKARVLIYPPSEDSVPALKESLNMLPKDNPYLQTGQDRLAEEVAHAQRGTDLYAPDSGALDGVAAGAGPV
jgi:hypothetical protein